MPNLDVRTGFIFVSVLYVLLPLATWLALKRMRTRAIDLWCLGGISFAASLVVIVVRGRDTDPFFTYLLNLLTMAALTLRIVSLRLDLNQPTHWKFPFVLFVLCSALGVMQSFGDSVLRVQMSTGLFSLVTGYMVYLAACLSTEMKSQNARWIAWTYALVLSAVIFRLIKTSLSGVFNLVDEGSVTQLLQFAYLQASVVGHIAYVGMVLDRSHRSNLALAARNARSDERQTLMLQISHLERVQTTERLSTVLAHEMAQPLTAVVAYAQAASRGLDSCHLSTQQVAGFLGSIIEEANRAKNIFISLREFIRPTSFATSLVDLHLIAHETVKLVQSQYKCTATELTLLPASSNFKVKGDPVLLMQVIFNLLRNAIESLTSTGGTMRIKVKVEAYRDKACVRILDNGPHLAADEIYKVGRPFFTSKPDGLGLGFSICMDIAERHQGSLVLRNAVFDADADRGVEAILELPLFSPELEVVS